jgi:hypothetical protein
MIRRAAIRRAAVRRPVVRRAAILLPLPPLKAGPQVAFGPGKATWRK